MTHGAARCWEDIVFYTHYTQNHVQYATNCYYLFYQLVEQQVGHTSCAGCCA